MKKNGLNIDQRTIRQFKLGDELAFELIFNKSKGKLKGFLNKVLPAGEDAESILQEIFLKIWLNRKQLKTHLNFETYLFTIARNQVIDVMRKRINKNKYLEELYLRIKSENDNSLDTFKQVEYSELEKKIFELLERLPEKRRLIFKLNRLEGLSYKEIATKLNISENTVDSQMRKALEYLRIEMAKYLTILLWIYISN